MKHLFLSATFFLVFAVYGKSQENNFGSDTIRTVLENDKLKVVEYVSTPGKDACGKGWHSHVPHLTIFFTDALMRLTTKDGKEQDFDLRAGFTFWSEAETHMVTNNGSNPVKVYLIELK